MPDLSSHDAKVAISAAHRALQGVWSTYDVKTRSKLLRDIAGAMQRDVDSLAKIITLENGKPLRDAKAEVLFSADYFEVCLSAFSLLDNDSSPSPWIFSGMPP